MYYKIDVCCLQLSISENKPRVEKPDLDMIPRKQNPDLANSNTLGWTPTGAAFNSTVYLTSFSIFMD